MLSLFMFHVVLKYPCKHEAGNEVLVQIVLDTRDTIIFLLVTRYSIVIFLEQFVCQ